MANAELTVQDLRSLGSVYFGTPTLEIDEDESSVGIVHQAAISRSLISTIVPVAFFCGVFLCFLYWIGIGGGNPQIWMVLALIGILTVATPVVIHQLQLNDLDGKNPLVEFDRRKGVVSICGRSEAFPADDVNCLLGLSLVDSEGSIRSELQLIVRIDDGQQSHLICTSGSCYIAKAHGDVMADFNNLTGIKVLIAEPQEEKRFGSIQRSGPVQIKEIELGGNPTKRHSDSD